MVYCYKMCMDCHCLIGKGPCTVGYINQIIQIKSFYKSTATDIKSSRVQDRDYIPSWCRLLGGRLQTDPHLCSVPTQCNPAESHSPVLDTQYTHTWTHRYGHTKEDKRTDSDQAHTSVPTHTLLLLVRPFIYQACQSALQCVGVCLNLPLIAENDWFNVK